jgi:glutamine amidotransferase
MIGIIDYGLGNIRAFLNAYEKLHIPCKLIKNNNDFKQISKIILPGVGAFDHAMTKLNESGIRNQLEDLVIKFNMPVLGICVGMQILSNYSQEGNLSGLGWIDGYVKKFDPDTIPFKSKLPHMGWNTICSNKENPIINKLENDSIFYFLHSYYFQCSNNNNILTTTNYGINYTSSVNKDNIYGVQFHPEKSHQNGLTILENFAKLC